MGVRSVKSVQGGGKRRVVRNELVPDDAGARLSIKASNKIESSILFFEGLAVACEVSMTDLHQARTPNPNAGIDAIGLLFSALVAAIVVGAGVIA
jgi:hypothetical protein